MPAIWGAAIAAGASIVSGIQKSQAQKKAAAALDKDLDVRRKASKLGLSLEDVYGRRLDAPSFNFGEGDIFRIANKLAEFNAGKGTDLANLSAGKINQQTLDDLEIGMSRLFGGGGSFERQRGLVNERVEDQLAGRLSEPTRRLLSRRALATGASAIGEGAVDDLFTGFLGLTTEGIVQQGIGNFQSLYSLYRQSFPLTTGLQTLPFTTLTPQAGVGFALQAATGQYSADLNAALAAAAPTPAAAGLIQDELQRGTAVSAARRGASIQAAESTAQAGAAIGGVVSQL